MGIPVRATMSSDMCAADHVFKDYPLPYSKSSGLLIGDVLGLWLSPLGRNCGDVRTEILRPLSRRSPVLVEPAEAASPFPPLALLALGWASGSVERTGAYSWS